VSNFILPPLRGEPITIYGGGAQTLSFGFVDGLIAGFFRLMVTDDTELGPINLGSPDQVSELAEITISLMDFRSPVVFKPLPVVDRKQRKPDIVLACQKIQAKPKIRNASTPAYNRLFQIDPLGRV
jgi:UDP-glucuronate decarboxylase